MTEKNQDPTTPEATPPAESEQAEPQSEPPTEAAAEKKARRRPSRGQLLMACGALVAVLAVASAGFAVGRTTAGDGDRRDHPAHGERFEHRGPGGPGMPAVPRG